MRPRATKRYETLFPRVSRKHFLQKRVRMNVNVRRPVRVWHHRQSTSNRTRLPPHVTPSHPSPKASVDVALSSKRIRHTTTDECKILAQPCKKRTASKYAKNEVALIQHSRSQLSRPMQRDRGSPSWFDKIVALRKSETFHTQREIGSTCSTTTSVRR